jgi:hypothetical protein
VTITVGKDTSQKTFQMYRGLLCFHSKYFKNLFEGGFREARSETHMMPETAVDIFELFYTWVCTGNLRYGMIDLAIATRLYAFADYHMVEGLKNRSVELFLVHTTLTWNTWYSVTQDSSSTQHFSATQDIYDRTTEYCPLRRLHVDILLTTCTFSSFRTCVDDLPTCFIADLFEAAIAQGMGIGNPPAQTMVTWFMGMERNFCKNYHEHTQDSTEPA